MTISRGLPLGLRAATELPCTSASTLSANPLTSSRQTRAGACSNPEGPGVSSSFLRKPSVEIVIAATVSASRCDRAECPG